MRDGLERYLEDVICRANLAREDERVVEAELREHLQVLAAASQASTPKEIYAMLEQEFGPAKAIGSGIARAKGQFRTFLKKQMRIKPIAVALVLAFMVRWAVAAPFYAASDAAAPQVPQGSRVLVYKLAKTFVLGDVVVYRNADNDFRMGIVTGVQTDGLNVQKRGQDPMFVPIDHIVGRVFLTTR